MSKLEAEINNNTLLKNSTFDRKGSRGLVDRRNTYNSFNTEREWEKLPNNFSEDKSKLNKNKE